MWYLIDAIRLYIIFFLDNRSKWSIHPPKYSVEMELKGHLLNDILNEWKRIVKCLFPSQEKKITHHLTTPTLLTLPLVTIVLYVLFDTFFSRLHFIWYRKFAPRRPRPFSNLFRLHISLLRWLLFLPFVSSFFFHSPLTSCLLLSYFM